MCHRVGHEGTEKTLHRLREDFHVGVSGGARVGVVLPHLPEEQDRAATPGGAAATAPSAIDGMGGHRRRLHQRPPERSWQVMNPHRHRPLLYFSRATLLRQCRQASRHPRLVPGSIMSDHDPAFTDRF
jgi:hypothetical protein